MFLYTYQDINVDEECLLYSEQQVDQMVEAASPEPRAQREGAPGPGTHRAKRSVTTESQKWSNPLLYKFDGGHCKLHEKWKINITNNLFSWKRIIKFYKYCELQTGTLDK